MVQATQLLLVGFLGRSSQMHALAHNNVDDIRKLWKSLSKALDGAALFLGWVELIAGPRLLNGKTDDLDQYLGGEW